VEFSNILKKEFMQEMRLGKAASGNKNFPNQGAFKLQSLKVRKLNI